jgi:hypothetical protein
MKDRLVLSLEAVPETIHQKACLDQSTAANQTTIASCRAIALATADACLRVSALKFATKANLPPPPPSLEELQPNL